MKVLHFNMKFDTLSYVFYCEFIKADTVLICVCDRHHNILVAEGNFIGDKEGSA